MKNWIFNAVAAVLFLGGIALLEGCYPNDSISTSETDIVLTGYYDSVNFNSLKTYYMPDTIFTVREDTTDKDPIPNQDDYLQAIANNFAAYGYTRISEVDTANPPDVMVSVAGLLITNISVGWWYPYYPGWGWYWKSSTAERSTDYWYPYYPGYYPPGWGWGGVPYYSSYTTGTLLMEMSNPDDIRVIDHDTVVPLYWAGALNGVMSSSASGDKSRVLNGIDQAFDQSTYLKTN